MFLSLINHAKSRLLHNRPLRYFFKVITGLLGSEQRQNPTRGVETGEPFPKAWLLLHLHIQHTFLCQLIKDLALKDECAFSDFWVSSSHLIISVYLFIYFLSLSLWCCRMDAYAPSHAWNVTMINTLTEVGCCLSFFHFIFRSSPIICTMESL